MTIEMLSNGSFLGPFSSVNSYRPQTEPHDVQSNNTLTSPDASTRLKTLFKCDDKNCLAAIIPSLFFTLAATSTAKDRLSPPLQKALADIEPLMEQAEKIRGRLDELVKRDDTEKTIDAFNELNRLYPRISEIIETAVHEEQAKRELSNLEMFIVYGEKFRSFREMNEVLRQQTAYLEGLGIKKAELYRNMAYHYMLMASYYNVSLGFLAEIKEAQPEIYALKQRYVPVEGQEDTSIIVNTYRLAAEAGLKAAAIEEEKGDIKAAEDSYQRTANVYREIARSHLKAERKDEAIEAYFEADRIMENSARLQIKEGDLNGFFSSRLTQLDYLENTRKLIEESGNLESEASLYKRRLELAESIANELKGDKRGSVGVDIKAETLNNLAAITVNTNRAKAAGYLEMSAEAYDESRKGYIEIGNFEAAHKALEKSMDHFMTAARLWKASNEPLASARAHIKAGSILRDLAGTAIRGDNQEAAKHLYQNMTMAFDAAQEVLVEAGIWSDIETALERNIARFAIEGREPHPLESFVSFYDMILSGIETARKMAHESGDIGEAERLEGALQKVKGYDQWTQETGMRQSISDIFSNIAPLQWRSEGGKLVTHIRDAAGNIVETLKRGGRTEVVRPLIPEKDITHFKDVVNSAYTHFLKGDHEKAMSDFNYLTITIKNMPELFENTPVGKALKWLKAAAHEATGDMAALLNDVAKRVAEYNLAFSIMRDVRPEAATIIAKRMEEAHGESGRQLINDIYREVGPKFLFDGPLAELDGGTITPEEMARPAVDISAPELGAAKAEARTEELLRTRREMLDAHRRALETAKKGREK